MATLVVLTMLGDRVWVSAICASLLLVRGFS